MGYSTWSDDSFMDRKAKLNDAGYDSGFTHDTDIKKGKVAAGTHDRLNPKGVIRESRDSKEHPESNAIMVWFDETGSMGGLPRIFQKALPKLHSIITLNNYIKDPQVLFGCFGDATCDGSPLQVGQFESGNEMDDDLGVMYLEGNGGGQNTESYELAMYFSYYKTAIDCFEKRGKKGYLFITGDETAYPRVSRAEVENLIGDKLQADIPLTEMVEKLKEKFEVFFIIPRPERDTQSWLKPFWTKLFGVNVFFLEKPEGIAELIASTIGLTEGAADLASVEAHISDKADALVVRSVIDTVSKYASVTTGALAKTTGTVTPSTAAAGNERI